MAAALVLQTREAVRSRLPTQEAVVAAGYSSIGDGFPISSFEHFVNPAYVNDGRELDPQRVESIVVESTPTGKWVVSAMYILEPGHTMRRRSRRRPAASPRGTSTTTSAGTDRVSGSRASWTTTADATRAAPSGSPRRCSTSGCGTTSAAPSPGSKATGRPPAPPTPTESRRRGLRRGGAPALGAHRLEVAAGAPPARRGRPPAGGEGVEAARDPGSDPFDGRLVPVAALDDGRAVAAQPAVGGAQPIGARPTTPGGRPARRGRVAPRPPRRRRRGAAPS